MKKSELNQVFETQDRLVELANICYQLGKIDNYSSNRSAYTSSRPSISVVCNQYASDEISWQVKYDEEWTPELESSAKAMENTLLGLIDEEKAAVEEKMAILNTLSFDA